jgi:hypothetical protein
MLKLITLYPTSNQVHATLSMQCIDWLTRLIKSRRYYQGVRVRVYE